MRHCKFRIVGEGVQHSARLIKEKNGSISSVLNARETRLKALPNMGQPILSGNLEFINDLPLAKCPEMRKESRKLQNFLLVNKTLKKSGLQGKLEQFRKLRQLEGITDGFEKKTEQTAQKNKQKAVFSKPTSDVSKSFVIRKSAVPVFNKRVLPALTETVALKKLKGLNHKQYLRENTLFREVVKRRGFGVHEHAEKCLELTKGPSPKPFG